MKNFFLTFAIFFFILGVVALTGSGPRFWPAVVQSFGSALACICAAVAFHWVDRP